MNYNMIPSLEQLQTRIFILHQKVQALQYGKQIPLSHKLWILSPYFTIYNFEILFKVFIVHEKCHAA